MKINKLQAGFTVITSLVVLSACGGGGGGSDGDGTPPTTITSPPVTSFPSALSFETPSSFGSSSSYAVGSPSIQLTGDLASAFMPRGLCPGDVSGLDFEIRWTNARNGTSGTAPIAFGCITVTIGGVPTPGIRSAFEIGPVSLEMGSNQIEMNTFDGAEQIGRDVVTLIREDQSSPKVTGTFPRRAATDVPTNRKLLVRFNEPMLESSLRSDRFELTGSDGIAVDIEASYDEATRSWVIQPVDSLNSSMRYTARVLSAVQDTNGNELDRAYDWTFTTGSDGDASSPSIASFWPGSSCLCAPASARLLVNLDEPLDPASSSGVTLEVSGSGLAVQGTTVYGGDFFEFVPATEPSVGVEYTLSVTGTALDLAGNAVELSASSDFTLQAQVPVGTWTDTSLESVPEGLAGAQAVWTGSEVLFRNNTGGVSFDPVANQWNTDNAFHAGPSLYYGETATWTGEEMIVWGQVIGDDPGVEYRAGGVYNPSTKTWRDILVPENALSAPRSQHVAVWTGSELIVWGGEQGDDRNLVSGGWRYAPVEETVNRMTQWGAPSRRREAQVVWTGEEMIVWGGFNDDGVLTDGGIYNPAIDQWRELPPLPDSYAAGAHAAVIWTGDEMLLWNGGISRNRQWQNNERRETSLYRFNPVTNEWRASESGWEPFTVTSNSAYTSLYEDGHFVTWTGTHMLVVSKFPADPVYLYDPLTDSWQLVADTENFGTDAATAIWAGDRLVQWGGRIGYVTTQNDGLILSF